MKKSKIILILCCVLISIGIIAIFFIKRPNNEETPVVEVYGEKLYQEDIDNSLDNAKKSYENGIKQIDEAGLDQDYANQLKNQLKENYESKNKDTIINDWLGKVVVRKKAEDLGYKQDLSVAREKAEEQMNSILKSSPNFLVENGITESECIEGLIYAQKMTEVYNLVNKHFENNFYDKQSTLSLDEQMKIYVEELIKKANVKHYK